MTDSHLTPDTRWLVFSDLDGTFLDHHSYSYQAALDAFDWFRSQNIPVIWNTSKTAREVLEFRSRLNPDTPFIVENGAAIYWPAELSALPQSVQTLPVTTIGALHFHVHLLGPAYSLVRQQLEALHRNYSFTGFSEMDTAQVQDCTGLSAEAADLARQRGHTEPLLWQDSEERKAAFTDELNRLGLAAVQGGRFLTVGGQHDKGSALNWLAGQYSQTWVTTARTLALGDGGNDIPMLQQADVAVTIPSASGKTLNISEHEHVIRPARPGPEGWHEAWQTWRRDFFNND